MELPIELVSEIANQSPFRSFMRYLNRETKKYWEDRTLDFDNPRVDITKNRIRPDLIIALDPKKILSNEQKRLMCQARFLIIDPVFISRDIMQNCERINLNDCKVEKIDLKHIHKMTNYRYRLEKEDKEMIISKFPESKKLINYYVDCSDIWHTPYDVWDILLINNKTYQEELVVVMSFWDFRNPTIRSSIKNIILTDKTLYEYPEDVGISYTPFQDNIFFSKIVRAISMHRKTLRTCKIVVENDEIRNDYKKIFHDMTRKYGSDELPDIEFKRS